MPAAPPAAPRKVAIVHDWLTLYAGSERVLEQMLLAFPHADVYSLVDFVPEAQRGFLQGREVQTSFLQRWPLARRYYRHYLPLMPLAIEQFDLSGYDLVLSSSHAVAKGVLTGPDQLHLCMCYSPIRYAWDLQHQYLRESGLDKGLKGALARRILHRIRLWDSRTANGVDGFMAISQFIARRIWKVYRRDSQVIYPPVDVEAFTLQSQKQDFYLTASRMVPYKRVAMIVESFVAMPDKTLVVIGDGPEFAKVKAAAKGAANIRLLGYQPFAVLRQHMQDAKAFIFAAEEDFGIVPIEAQACGTPVIAYGKGGALETISPPGSANASGMFFPEQSVAALQAAVTAFEQLHFDPEAVRRNALRFAPERFQQELQTYVQQQWQAFVRGALPEMVNTTAEASSS